MFEVILLFVGVIIGVVIKTVFASKPIGCIRIDNSDPNSEPYLFLELEPGGIEKIRKSQKIVLKTNIKNYIA